MLRREDSRGHRVTCVPAPPRIPETPKIKLPVRREPRAWSGSHALSGRNLSIGWVYVHPTRERSSAGARESSGGSIDTHTHTQLALSGWYPGAGSTVNPISTPVKPRSSTCGPAPPSCHPGPQRKWLGFFHSPSRASHVQAILPPRPSRPRSPKPVIRRGIRYPTRNDNFKFKRYLDEDKIHVISPQFKGNTATHSS